MAFVSKSTSFRNCASIFSLYPGFFKLSSNSITTAPPFHQQPAYPLIQINMEAFHINSPTTTKGFDKSKVTTPLILILLLLRNV